MGRVIRHDSSVSVPVEQAQLIDPGAFRFSTAEAAALQSAGLTAQQIGIRQQEEREALQELAVRKRKATDSLSASKAVKGRQLADLEIEEANQLPEQEARQSARDAAIQKYNDLRVSLDMSEEQGKKEDIESDAWNAQTARKNTIFDTVSEIKADIAVGSATLIDIIGNDDGTPSDALQMQNQIESVRKALRREMTEEEAEIQLVEYVRQGKELRAEVSVENIKPNLIAAIDAGNKQDAIAVLGESLKQLVDDGVLTKAEGAQADKVLGDWIDNFVAGRISQAENAVKLTTEQSYLDLTEKILDRGDGKLNFNDIEQSSLLKADKEKWQGYIKGSYKQPPKENTPDGLKVAFTVVFNAATLQFSPQEAFDALLAARFEESSITEEQFKWGVDKVQNPYPKTILHDLQSVAKSNNEDFNRWLKRDKDRNKTVNESLFAWVDSQIEQGKLPTRKEMHVQSSQFRVGDDRWYDIGQVIDLGGREWEVVGFDESGEPLMEEVQ